MLLKQLSLCFILSSVFFTVPVSAKFIKADVRYPFMFENAFLENILTDNQHILNQNLFFNFNNRESNSNCTWNLFFVNNFYNFPDNHQTRTFMSSYHFLPNLSAAFRDNRSKFRICEKNNHHELNFQDNQIPDFNCGPGHPSNVPEPGIVSLLLSGLLSVGGFWLQKRI